MMKLIVGLGNPGREYAHTKHNVGFDVLDILAKRHKTKIVTRQSKALIGSFEYYGEQILFVKPQTFMNNSGESVVQIVRKNRIKPEDMFVIYDDMDLPLGKLRIRGSGSSGGHKGMKSLIQHLNSSEFTRIRIGIGRGGDVVDHVLSRFSRKDRLEMEVTLVEAADAIDKILADGLDAAMNTYNRSE